MKLEMLARAKWLKSLWMAFLLAAVVGACNEDESAEAQDEMDVGVVTPVGAPKGETQNFEVGPEGGTVRSADGIVELFIPQGAVSSATTIGIQPLENTAPNGVGYSYRLTPHGLTFVVPVSISFYYDEAAVSFIDGLAIAFQDADNIWYWPGNLSHHSTSRKVSVQSLHFSDWSLFESTNLKPAESAVLPGGQVELNATRVIQTLLYPLVQGDSKPLTAEIPLEEKYIEEWALSGEGKFTASGSTAVYFAPAAMPVSNPATVTLVLNYSGSTKFLLKSTITVGESRITLNGGPYVNYTAKAIQPGQAFFIGSGTSIHFSAVQGPALIAVMISFSGKSAGDCGWDGETCFVYTSHGSTGGQPAPMLTGTVMVLSDPPSVHSGYIKVGNYGNVGEVVSGSFQGGFTFIEPGKDEPEYGTISGTFIAQRKQ